MVAGHRHHVEPAWRPAIAEPAGQVQQGRAAYFAALSRIDARGGRAGPCPRAHLDEDPGGAIDGDDIDLAPTVAHIAIGDAQTLVAQEVAGLVFGRGAAALRGGRADGRDRRQSPAAPGRLHAMLAARRQREGGACPVRGAAERGRAGEGVDMEEAAVGGGADAWTGQSPWREAGLVEQEFAPGLYVVATPLGNAADVTLRALWVLRAADCVAVEDTRTTAPLLARFGIHQRLVALHQHNEAERLCPLLERLARGERVALVSDAGTPAISDPGALLVRAARAAGVRVIPVPGASSLTAALSVAGVRAGDIRFVGFAPTRSQARRRHWRSLATDAGALVIFEAPHRIAATARELADALAPGRRVLVARELTKKFESVVETTAAQLPGVIAASPPRGEYVLVIDAMPAPEAADEAVDGAGPAIDPATLRWLLALAEELPASRAAALASRVSGLPRALLYAALDHRSSDGPAPDAA